MSTGSPRRFEDSSSISARAAFARRSREAGRALATACKRVARRLLAEDASVAVGHGRPGAVETLEVRVLLTTYSPAGNGTIGVLELSGGTFASEDRIVMDLRATAGGAAQDVMNVTGSTRLGGLLDVAAMDLSGLSAGQVFPILSVGMGGSLSGAFDAVKGLEGTTTLDFAVIQGPTGVSLVATSLPTGDFTISVDSTTEFNALVSFFSTGAGSVSLSPNATSLDSLRFLGQRISGGMTFTAGESVLDIALLSNANTNQTGRVALNNGGSNLLEVFGSGEFQVGPRGGQGTSGLRLVSWDSTGGGYTLANDLGGTGAPASNLTNGTLGPLTLEKAEVGLSALAFDGQQLAVTAGFNAVSASVAFTKSNGSAPDGGSSPGGMTAKVDYPAGGIAFNASYDTAGARLTGLAPTGGFSFSAAGAEFEIPTVVKATAPNGAVISYDPQGGASQTLVSIPILKVELPRFNVEASVTPLQQTTDPGLVVRQDGFQFGNLTGTLKTKGGDQNATSIKFGSFASLDNPSVTISNFGYTVGGDNTIAGAALKVQAGSFRLGKETGSFYASGSNVSTTLTFGASGLPDAVKFRAEALDVHLGQYISASGSFIEFTPTAGASEEMLSVAGSLSASLNFGSLTKQSALTLTGSAGGFAIMGDGSFQAKQVFSVSLGIQANQLGSALGGMKFPSFIGIQSAGASIGISWPNFNTSPDRFLMQLSANVTGSLGTTSPVSLSGSFTNLTVDSKKIEDGQFPIIGISQASISASGNIFGGTLTGSLAMGTVLFDDQGQRLPDNAFVTNPDAIDDSVYWAAVSGGFTVANRGGFKLLFGVSELGPLQAYIRADVPVLLDPISGLTIDGFRGGVTFNATAFPDITDPIQLRNPLFKPTRDLTEAEWLTSLKALVVNQKGGNPGFLFQLDPATMNGQSASEWVSLLNTGWYPDSAWDPRLLEVGYALSPKIPDKSVTVLDAGDAWILDDRGTQFLITKTLTNKFNISAIGFHTHGELSSAMPSGNATKTASQITGTDADGNAISLVGAFAERGITLSGSALVSETTAGEVWEVDDNGVKFTLTKKGDGSGANTGVVRLIVTGGNGTFGTMNQTIKIEAGATFYSQYVGKEFFNLEADIVFTTDGNLLFVGDANWLTDPQTKEPQFTQNTKIYLQTQDFAAGAGKVFYLSDMPLSTANPAAGKLSVHGSLTFGFYDNAGTLITNQASLQAGAADKFEIHVAGSETQGLALADFAGYQRFRLGGRMDPDTGVQYGRATISVDPSPGSTQLVFEYNANLSAEGLIAADSFVRSAGQFVFEFGGDDKFQVWGVAMMEATTQQVRPLADAGILGQASATLNVNISDDPHDVVLDVPGSGLRTYKLKANSVGLHLFGSLTFNPPVIGGVLHQEIVGAFSVEGSQADGFRLLVLGTMPVPLPLVGTVASPLQADVLGAMVISAAGFAGRLELSLRDDLPQGTEQYFDLNFGLQFWANSTGVLQRVDIPGDIADRLGSVLPTSLTGRLDPGGQSISIPAGAPKLDGTNEGAGPYLVMMGTGLFTVANVFSLNGATRLAWRYDSAALANFWEFDASATLSLQPLGNLAAAGSLRIQDNSPNGNWRDLDMYGSLQLTGGMSVGSLSLTGYAALEFNTFEASDAGGGNKQVARYFDPATKDTTTTPRNATIGPNTLQVFVGGRMDVGPLFKLNGAFVLIDSPQKLSISVDAEMRSFFDVASFNVFVSAEVYKGADPGLVLDATIQDLGFGVDGIFTVDAEDIFLRVNTRNNTTNSLQGHRVEPGLELQIGSIETRVFNAVTFTGSGAFKVRTGVFGGNVWEFSASLSTNFFDVAHLSGNVLLRSSGEFKFDIYGGFSLGKGGTGIFGNGEIHVSYLAANAASTTELTSGDLQVSGRARVEGKLFGIKLGALNATFDYNGGTGELSVEACVEFWRPFEYDEICVDFTIGFLKAPPPIYLASNADDTAGRAFRGGTLYLNVGDRAPRRNFAPLTTNEAYYIEAVGAGSNQAQFPGGQRLRVVGLGRTQEFDNVTGIYGDAGIGSDHIEIGGATDTGYNVAVPVTLTGGTGNDRLEHDGAGSATLRGGDGADVLISGAAAARLEGEADNDQIRGGGNLDTVLGGAGDDYIFWAAGDGDDPVLEGGDGNDVQFIELGTGSDDVLVDRSAGQFSTKRLGVGGAVTEGLTADSGFETLDIDANAGADTITFAPMTGAGLTSVRLRLGTPTDGTLADGPASGPDSHADSVVIQGNTTGDDFSLTNPTAGTVQVTHVDVTVFTLYGATRSAGDAINVDAQGGDDRLDGSGLTHDLVAPTLTGGIGNDRLIGSRYNDHLDSGLGDDTVTGNAGTDTFADAGGNDTLLETRDADFTITDDTLVIGSLTGFAKAATPATGGVVDSPLGNRGSAYAGTAEFERVNSIFEHATLTGGASNNTFIVGDDDGNITHGGAAKSTSNRWSGNLTLDNVGSTGGSVEYYMVYLAAASGSRVTINESGPGDYDELYVVGTTGLDTFRVDGNGGKVTAGDPGNAAHAEVTHAGVSQVTVDALDGADTINVVQTVVPTVLHGRAGDDIINVGSLAPASGGNVNAIAHALYVNGNEGADALNVDDTGDTVANVGTLTSSRLTGLGMGSGGITYATLEAMTARLGGGSDTFNVQSTHAGTTTLHTNGGDDTVNVGSAGPGTGGNVNGIGGLLTIQSGDDADVLNIDDTGDTAANTGRLTSTRLTGLGMGADDGAKGIAYGGFETLNVSLGGGNDAFYVDSTHAGVTNVRAGAGADQVEVETLAGTTNFLGQAGDDLFTANKNRPTSEDDSEANGLDAVLNLDGNDGSDRYVVWIWGNGNSVINTYDTGSTGSDVLTMHGTSVDDEFLIRANFVAALAGKDDENRYASAERVNYDASMDGGIVVNGRLGDDHFASDDNATRTTLSGGAGRDFFQIGQVFEADRLPPHVAAGDSVGTTLTTVGYLTSGASHELTASGDDGNDTFIVFRNTARLSLNGGADNDVFTVRAFALASNGQYDQATTGIDAGTGDDLVQYAENAPVDVDGGSGFDRLRVLGTEFGDHFVVTDQGVTGAGLTVSYAGVEVLELHGGDGNDTFNVQSTADGVATYIYGGGGSDHVFTGKSGERMLSKIRGPLVVDGGLGDPSVFNIPLPVMFPGETDLPRGTGGHSSDGSQSTIELPGNVDVLDIFDTDTDADRTGTLTDRNLSGFGMGGDLTQEVEPGKFVTTPGGITYAKAEILEIQHGAGNDTLGVLGIAAGVITVIKGDAGNDTFHVSAPAAAGAFLVIHGDTAASSTHRSNPGNDLIDARTSSHAATYYGGAGNDTVYGSSATDHIAGGSGDDSLSGQAGADLIWGDSGFDVNRNSRVTTVVTSGQSGEDDFTCTGNDTVHAGSGNDVVFGDHGQITFTGGSPNVLAETGTVDNAQTVQRARGGNDVLTASDAGNTYFLGGAGSDSVTGGDGDDILLGDHGKVSFNLDGDPSTFDLVEVLDTPIGAGDSLSGGAGSDLILGQAGGDTISGGTGNDVLIGDNATVTPAGAALSSYDLRQRFGLHSGGPLYNADGTPNVTALGVGSTFVDPLGVPHLSVLFLEDDAATLDDGRYGNDSILGDDGNDVLFGQLGDDTLDGGREHDYIEANGGNDTLRGGLGQDVLVGGSSDRFGLTARSQRADGSDTILGGDGTTAGRNDPGDLSPDGHANDADLIAGDNANAFVVLSDVATGASPAFNYDNYGSLKVIPHVAQLLDYTFGGADSDLGAGDVAHGESGDDSIFGQTGDDVLFGDGQDDDVIGGAGHDRIYGGAGEDGVLGDDGIILTSRNGLTEPLNGLTTADAESDLSIPGQFTGAWVYISGRLFKTVRSLAWASGGNDVIYGGLGDDFLHGGAGDDAVSGAEALPEFWSDAPVTDSDSLGDDPATRKFAAYDAANPLRKIDGFLLNFDAATAAGDKIDDGKDNLFGGLGHDWLAGGTDNDRLFGGAGDDLMNADDNLGTNGDANDGPDEALFADRDFVYGGDGLDVLIANTGGDRLFDWSGEFNSYIVPFSPFGLPTVVRTPSPAIQQFLLDLGRSAGADQSRSEPDGELALFTQGDPQWGTNKGAPRDPQPGNYGAARDTQGGPEDDRGTALPLTLTAGTVPVPTTNATVAVNSEGGAVGHAFVSADPSDSSRKALFVGGTDAAERIDVRRGPSAGIIRVVINGVEAGLFPVGSGSSAIGRIIVFANGGNDTASVFADVGAIPAVIYGGGDHDTLIGGVGPTVLDGGDGDDSLVGGAGRDILVGGNGADTLNGGDGEDILIAGRYAQSADLDAVSAIASVWSSSAISRTDRIAQLRAGTGSDGLYRLGASTVFNDRQINTLSGGGDADWFFGSATDQLKDRKNNEMLDRAN